MADKYIRSLVVLNKKFSAKNLKGYHFICGKISNDDFERILASNYNLNIGLESNPNRISIRTSSIETIQASEKIYDAEKVYTVEE